MLHTVGIELHYWDEAFIYAVHIQRMTLTSNLEGITSFEAWTGQKSDISYLRIFGLLGWAQVQKEVRKGKLESRVVKVKILRWWSDETKGYRLEDLENNKLITLYNVWFFKDKTPSNLAVVEVNIKYPSTNDINRLVDNTINSNQDTATSITSRQSSDNIIPIAANDTLTYHTLLLFLIYHLNQIYYLHLHLSSSLNSLLLYQNHQSGQIYQRETYQIISKNQWINIVMTWQNS